MYKGVRIPGMCCWSKNGSITLDILVDILAAREHLKGFEVNRAAGILHFLLVDGHGARFQLPFLRYIHDPLHEWVVVIGVPYGATFW